MSTPTETEKRVLIAEACGWTQFTGKNREIYGTTPDEEYRTQIPDYFFSLDAMHKAEEALNKPLTAFYGGHLRNICEGYIWHATPAQRAEAFGRTLNLWS